MEIYVAVLEEDARVAGKDADLRAFTDKDEGMRAEYEQACLVASDALAEPEHVGHQKTVCLYPTTRGLEQH